jgi:dinuclear metal center YbgI/SA1388 family protein
MKIIKLCQFLEEKLEIAKWREEDASQNGLQVQPQNDEIKLVAVSVDANNETIAKAVREGADLLLVHHGLFWGTKEVIVGLLYQRLHSLMTAGVGLFACHLPIDPHSTLGNGAGVANKLGLTDKEKLDVGWSGILPQELTLEAVTRKLGLESKDHYHALPFGKEKIKRVGIITGGAGGHGFINLALAAKCDLYITGELIHSGVQFAKDARLNLLGAGHYWTETFGVRAVAKYLEQELKVKTVWLENPTGF